MNNGCRISSRNSEYVQIINYRILRRNRSDFTNNSRRSCWRFSRVFLIHYSDERAEPEIEERDSRRRDSINIERSTTARGYCQSIEPNFSRITRKLLHRMLRIDHFFSAHPITPDARILRTLARLCLWCSEDCYYIEDKKTRLSPLVLITS